MLERIARGPQGRGITKETNLLIAGHPHMCPILGQELESVTLVRMWRGGGSGALENYHM